MFLSFPKNFFWGTSTAAAQVETAGDHPWRGLVTADGNTFERTTDHELHRKKDAGYIARFGSVYRCGVDWSRLQTKPMAKFDPAVVDEYCTFFEYLKGKGISLMFVLHHFCHPNWFEQKGGWTKEENIDFFVNYTQQCIKHFGKYASWWNTFNEPNVYAYNAYFSGHFPPFKKGRYFTANRALDNMGRAHEIVRVLIREKSKNTPVGISLNTAYFKASNFLGQIPALFARWWFLNRAARPFQKCDFWGLSYYAYLLFDPFPVDMVNRPEVVQRLGLPHDKMWLYKPEGLGWVLRRFWKKYKKPIVITENGICSDDNQERIQAIRDYLRVCHEAIEAGVDLRGYIHWSTWDNFEWHLGPTFRFGLVRVNFNTMERSMTPAGAFYEKVTQQNGVEV
ncbi:MAG: family 1 glycosylhydrolase [Lewinellaceae bacterium]|nr:family 1 glycosylhydrolase [Saprospiraceae bacterium]MCB9330790.1 family 1 glycosylhydrolase [Lewinellaceae bacterium]